MSYGNQPGGYGPPSGGHGPYGDHVPGGYGPADGYGAGNGYGVGGGPVSGGGYGTPGAYGPSGGYDPYGYGPPPPRGNNGMAIAALILGIAGLFLCGITSIVGVVLGHVSLGQIKRTGEEGRGMAVAGLVLSYFGIACWVGVVLVWLAFFGLFAGAAYTGL